jgi:hypothetical protein
MSQRVEYGAERQAIAYYDVIVWWWTAFEIEDQSFNPSYIPEEMLEDMRQEQRRYIVQSLPESDPGRKYLILKFFPNGL